MRRKVTAALTALVAIGLLSSCAPARTDVTIDGITVSAELANTPERQQKGPSGRVDPDLKNSARRGPKGWRNACMACFASNGTETTSWIPPFIPHSQEITNDTAQGTQ